MRTTPTPEQLEKLPKWAQEYIKDLDRRMIVAERTLKEYTDSQTVSKIFYDDIVCVGGGSPAILRRYVQSQNIEINHAGVGLRASIFGQESIELSWSNELRGLSEVAMIPLSFGKLKLVTRENMR